MDIQTYLQKIENLELTEELQQVKDAMNGFKKGDLFIFYNDAEGKGRVLFLDNLKHFPYNVENELKILLQDAAENYFLQINKNNKENEQH